MASSAIDKADRADDQAKRTVWVGNMAWKTKWQDLKDHMKPAGDVEFVKPLTYDGTDWGMSKGMALVRYATESEAANAIATLNDSELHDRKIVVEQDCGKKKEKGGKGKGKGGWFMPPWMMQYMAKGKGKGKGSTRKIKDEACAVYVESLAWKTRWQDLKDHMAKAGTIEFAQVFTQDGSEYGRSKGTGYVEYSTAAEAQNALATLAGSELDGREIKVEGWWKEGEKPEREPKK